jgi:hypothetical protein
VTVRFGPIVGYTAIRMISQVKHSNKAFADSKSHTTATAEVLCSNEHQNSDGHQLSGERRSNSMQIGLDAEDDDVNLWRTSNLRNVMYPNSQCLPPPAKFVASMIAPARYSRIQKSKSCSDVFQSTVPSFKQVAFASS